VKPDIRIRGMTLEDIPSVLLIDQQSFPLPWSERTYRFELTRNDAAHLLVAETSAVHSPVIIGYIGFWIIIDEVHISTIAVAPGYRREGIGRRLLTAALVEARRRGAQLATLEVRISNDSAIHLYEEFGFEVVGKRKGYYRDNHEDALIMTVENYDIAGLRLREASDERSRGTEGDRS